MSREQKEAVDFNSYTIKCDKCGDSMTDCEGKEELESFAISVGWQIGVTVDGQVVDLCHRHEMVSQ